MAETKERLLYLDAMRGTAMLMVVYSHLISFCMDGIAPSPLGQYMRDIILPLFFFISGFCAISQKRMNTINQLGKNLLKKVNHILIPTIVMFLVFMLYTGNDIKHNAMNYDKSGYWFTWVLFQIFVVYLLSRYISDRFAYKDWQRILIILSPLAIMFVIFRFVGFESQAAVFFEWVKVKGFYMYFLLGVLLKLYHPVFDKLCLNKYFTAGLLVSSIIEYKIGGKELIANILTFYFIFSRLFNTPNIVTNVLTKIGENSLAVYFLHFFLLFRLPQTVSSYIESLKMDTCFGSNSCSSIAEFLLCMNLALIISFAALLVQHILRQFPLIYRLCLGPDKSTKPYLTSNK